MGRTPLNLRGFPCPPGRPPGNPRGQLRVRRRLSPREASVCEEATLGGSGYRAFWKRQSHRGSAKTVVARAGGGQTDRLSPGDV